MTREVTQLLYRPYVDSLIMMFTVTRFNVYKVSTNSIYSCQHIKFDIENKLANTFRLA